MGLFGTLDPVRAEAKLLATEGKHEEVTIKNAIKELEHAEKAVVAAMKTVEAQVKVHKKAFEREQRYAEKLKEAATRHHEVYTEEQSELEELNARRAKLNDLEEVVRNKKTIIQQLEIKHEENTLMREQILASPAPRSIRLPSGGGTPLDGMSPSPRDSRLGSYFALNEPGATASLVIPPELAPRPRNVRLATSYTPEGQAFTLHAPIPRGAARRGSAYSLTGPTLSMQPPALSPGTPPHPLSPVDGPSTRPRTTRLASSQSLHERIVTPVTTEAPLPPVPSKDEDADLSCQIPPVGIASATSSLEEIDLGAESLGDGSPVTMTMTASSGGSGRSSDVGVGGRALSQSPRELERMPITAPVMVL